MVVTNGKRGFMKGYRELKLIGSAVNQEKLIDCIVDNLTSEWERRKDLDAPPPKSSNGYRAFVLTDPKYRFPVALRFQKPEIDGYYYLSSVQPQKLGGALSLQEENSIIERFYKAFVEGRASEFDVRAILTSDNKSPENMMSPELLSKFQLWQANASTADLRSVNAKYDFIIQAHREGSSVDSDMIRDYLSRTLEEKDLKAVACFYREGRELLERFDGVNK